jgi:hypothetical protein
MGFVATFPGLPQKIPKGFPNVGHEWVMKRLPTGGDEPG